MRFWSLFIMLFWILPYTWSSVWAQELDCAVKVVSNAANLSDKSTLQQMENIIKEFMNNQKWTNDRFEPFERIKSSIQISIREDKGNNSYVCDLTIQATRPIFKSSYESMLFQLTEKDVPLVFDPFRPLENNRDIFTDNLSAVLTFYAYFILTLDYDSFSLEGGEPFLTILQNMISALPSGAKSFDPSWSSASGKKNSRYFLFENITNARLKPFRRAFYEYHRIGLDQSHQDMNLVRKDLVSSILAIAQTDQTYPNTFLIQSFINAKRPEIVEIFKNGTPIEKSDVHRAMIEIDPSNSSAYDLIKS